VEKRKQQAGNAAIAKVWSDLHALRIGDDEAMDSYSARASGIWHDGKVAGADLKEAQFCYLVLMGLGENNRWSMIKFHLIQQKPAWTMVDLWATLADEDNRQRSERVKFGEGPSQVAGMGAVVSQKRSHEDEDSDSAGSLRKRLKSALATMKRQQKELQHFKKKQVQFQDQQEGQTFRG
jgi:hypothetical protein